MAPPRGRMSEFYGLNFALAKSAREIKFDVISNENLFLFHIFSYFISVAVIKNIV